MKIILIGAGEVGSHLAKFLAQDNNDIVVIETNPEKCQRISSQLDVMVIPGNGTDPKLLKQADAKNADMLIAVSSIDEVNIITCMIAKQFGIPRKIARIRSHFYDDESILDPKELGIDFIIRPEEETAYTIIRLLKRSAATDVVEFPNGKVQVLGIRLDDYSPIIGMSLEKLTQEYTKLTFRVVVIHRLNKSIVPRGSDTFQKRDQVFFATLTEDVPRVVKLAGKANEKLEKIMILGAGKVGRLVAEMTPDNANVKIIESNIEKSQRVAEQLSKAMIIQGDGTDLDLLAIEGILDMDAFVAVTNNENTNIISSLLARHLGVKKTIALVEKADYMPIVPTIGLDAAVSKRVSTADAILNFIRSKEIHSLTTLHDVNAEVVELIPRQNAKITRKPLRKIKLPRGVVLGAVVRNGNVIIPTGDTQIQENDEVVVFLKLQLLNDVQKMFG